MMRHLSVSLGRVLMIAAGMFVAGFSGGAEEPEVDKNALLYAEAKKLYSQRNWEPAIDAFEKVAGASAPGAMRQASIRNMVAAYGQLGQHDRARELNERFLSDFPQASDSVKVETRRQIARYYTGIKDYEKAIALNREIIKKYPKVGVTTLAAVEYEIALALFNAESYDESIAQCQAIIERYSKLESRVSADAYARIIIIHTKRSEFEQAAAATMKLLEFDVHRMQSGLQPHLRTALGDVEKLELGTEAVDKIYMALKAGLVNGTHVAALCADIQETIVRLLFGQGDHRRAFAEARLFYEAAPPTKAEVAAEYMARALKGLDGNVARANAVLDYLKTGAAGPDGKLKTADDVTDPVADLKIALSPEVEALFVEAEKTIARDWKGRRQRATLYRYWGKPKQALAELKACFALAPMDGKNLQPVADEIVDVLILLSGDRAIGERYIDYVKLGAAGADGKKGTADDLTDPVVEYLK